MLRQAWLLLVLHAFFVHSSVLPVNERCVTAVYTAYRYIPFDRSTEVAPGLWGWRCQNPLEVISIYAAADVYCTSSERSAGFAQLQSFCQQHAHVELLSRESLAANLTNDAISRMRRVDYGEIPRSEPVEYPVLLSATFYRHTFHTIETLEFEVWTHSAYGWPEVSTQLIRYVADRTGILSFANLSLLWLFAGRNNVFIWATGWSFATFNIFHRHIAWIATIQALVHTLLYLALFIQNGSVWKKLQKPYVIWGTIAMVAMLLLSPFAISWFRRRTYETFLVLHILFSVAALVGCFQSVPNSQHPRRSLHLTTESDSHTTFKSQNPESWTWLWPAVSFWTADRLLRVIRLMYYNLHVHVHAGKSVQYTRSSATYDEACDVIRLEVIPGTSRLQPTPGQYYYLYQPFKLTGWENHPFTLGSWSYEAGLPMKTQPPAFAKPDNPLDVTQVPLLSDTSSDSRPPPDDEEPRTLRLVFWIRPFDGWTRHLRHQCLRSHGQTLATILLEGPYGDASPLWNYESVLFIAGGTGIAAAVPYIHDHLARCSGEEGESATRVQNMHLVWTSRQEAFVRDIANRELRSALLRDDFRASFYVTSATSGQGDALEGLSGKAVEVAQGRPDLQAVVLAHAHAAQLSDCAAAVLMCGPPAMADEVRDAVYQAMRQGYQGVRYMEESFGW
ncbi:ferric reductase like transmembrane component-domain-containing protein [Aspergillus coremiiformis]|uniref:Ferric reductase like transmembrane component-domain-containing protein n=1 Tax=Aspergillus coremiiformis TaxID=138285 RepID=A0A5N6Z9L1_9EURO|nr:ferric reductase like transmembrane component-domain-containing protein [Aspergillus coremiiformis]